MGFSLGGLIGGALEGAGKAGGEVAQGLIDTQNKISVNAALQDAEAMKQARIDEYRVGLADRQRTAQAARIDGALGGLVNSKFGSGAPDEVAKIDAGQTDAPLTPEQRAVIDKADQGRADAMNDPDLRLAAAAKTGDLDLNTQAGMSARVRAAESRADALRYGVDGRVESAKYVADKRQETEDDKAISRSRDVDAKAAAAERIAAEKAKLVGQRIASLNPVEKANLVQSASWDRDNKIEDGQVRRLMDSKKTLFNDADKAKADQQIEMLNQKIAERQARRDKLLLESARMAETYRMLRDAPGAADKLINTPKIGGGVRPDVQSALDKFNNYGR